MAARRSCFAVARHQGKDAEIWAKPISRCLHARMVIAGAGRQADRKESVGWASIFGREAASRQVDEHCSARVRAISRAGSNEAERLRPSVPRQPWGVRTNASIATVQLARMKSCKDAGLPKSMKAGAKLKADINKSAFRVV